MGLLLRLAALFILVPLVELWLLLEVARHTSVTTTLLVVVVTGVIGTLLARAQGWRTFRTIRRELSHGHVPTDALLDAAMIFLAGALLLTPGLLTDAFGLSLLVPACRRGYRRLVARWIRRHFTVDSAGPYPRTDRSRVIDVHVVRKDPDDPD
jgi:UPF0716 protein FxsA